MLCITAVLGGWPAGYWAMRRFRHKSAAWRQALHRALWAFSAMPGLVLEVKSHGNRMNMCLSQRNGRNGTREWYNYGTMCLPGILDFIDVLDRPVVKSVIALFVSMRTMMFAVSYVYCIQ